MYTFICFDTHLQTYLYAYIYVLYILFVAINITTNSYKNRQDINDSIIIIQ